jgi:hypothetical protein
MGFEMNKNRMNNKNMNKKINIFKSKIIIKYLYRIQYNQFNLQYNIYLQSIKKWIN